MASRRETLLKLIRKEPGLSDRQLTDRLLGQGEPQQAVNSLCRQLEAEGLCVRRKRSDGRLGNYPGGVPVSVEAPAVAEPDTRVPATPSGISEDDVKRAVKERLEKAGWECNVAWGGAHGIDIDAHRNGRRWIIEAKGSGKSNPQRVNYFVGALGELLQRTNDPNADYGIALPDVDQYRKLWDRLPSLAKRRMRLSALFVAEDGSVLQES